MTHDEALVMMVDRLRKAFHPQRIVLFGSHARGNAGPNSDIDLLVVVDKVENPWIAMAKALRLFPDLPVPKDIIITDRQQLSRRQTMPHTIEAIAMAEGRIVYAA